MNLEAYFAPFRANIIGIDQEFESPFGRQRIVYADWTASGRMFRRMAGLTWLTWRRFSILTAHGK